MTLLEVLFSRPTHFESTAHNFYISLSIHILTSVAFPFSELSAIQSELVLRKQDFLILIPLIHVLVNHNHYASKTGVGHERIVERVQERVSSVIFYLLQQT